jgi:hypothetical protein
MQALFAASADPATEAAVRTAYEFLGTAVEARRNLTIAVQQLRQAKGADETRAPAGQSQAPATSTVRPWQSR